MKAKLQNDGLIKLSKQDDRFRPRGPSYQRWTATIADPALIEASWKEALNGPMGINKLKPEDIAGYRIQINFKRPAR